MTPCVMCRFNDLYLRVTLDLLESKVLLEHLGKKDHLGFQDPKGRLESVVKMYVKFPSVHVKEYRIEVAYFTIIGCDWNSRPRRHTRFSGVKRTKGL